MAAIKKCWSREVAARLGSNLPANDGRRHNARFSTANLLAGVTGFKIATPAG